jgi:hypothetical protein
VINERREEILEDVARQTASTRSPSGLDGRLTQGPLWHSNRRLGRNRGGWKEVEAVDKIVDRLLEVWLGRWSLPPNEISKRMLRLPLPGGDTLPLSPRLSSDWLLAADRGNEHNAASNFFWETCARYDYLQIDSAVVRNTCTFKYYSSPNSASFPSAVQSLRERRAESIGPLLSRIPFSNHYHCIPNSLGRSLGMHASSP